MSNDYIPPVPVELVDFLEKHVPEKCPEKDWTDREIWIYVGRRSLVTLLKHYLNEHSNRNKDNYVSLQHSQGPEGP